MGTGRQEKQHTRRLNLPHELDGLAGRVIAVMDAFLADMIGQSVPAAVAQRFQELVLATCIRQREHVRQIARFKRSDFE